MLTQPDVPVGDCSMTYWVMSKPKSLAGGSQDNCT